MMVRHGVARPVLKSFKSGQVCISSIILCADVILHKDYIMFSAILKAQVVVEEAVLAVALKSVTRLPNALHDAA